MLWYKDKLFCEINPFCYAISEQKEICKRHIQNLLSGEKFARTFNSNPEDTGRPEGAVFPKEKLLRRILPNLISKRETIWIKKGCGIDPVLQENKAVNLNIACEKINRIVIHPGEAFSFWLTLGKTTKRNGYKEGRVIVKNRVAAGYVIWQT